MRTDEVDLASVKDASLADVMEAGGGDENPILVDPIPNVYFTRDTFSVIGSGVSLNRMRSATRRRESSAATSLRITPSTRTHPSGTTRRAPITSRAETSWC